MQPAERTLDKKLLFLLLAVTLLGIAMALFGPRYSLDAKLYYSGDEARALLLGFDASELRRYFLNEILDLLLIASYTGALFLGLRRVFSHRTFAIVLALAPGACDFVETVFILCALQGSGPDSFFDWLGVITLLKWILGAIAVLAFAWGTWQNRGLGIRSDSPDRDLTNQKRSL